MLRGLAVLAGLAAAPCTLPHPQPCRRRRLETLPWAPVGLRPALRPCHRWERRLQAVPRTGMVCAETVRLVVIAGGAAALLPMLPRLRHRIRVVVWPWALPVRIVQLDVGGLGHVPAEIVVLEVVLITADVQCSVWAGMVVEVYIQVMALCTRWGWLEVVRMKGG